MTHDKPEPGRAPTEAEDAEMDIKKCHLSPQPSDLDDEFPPSFTKKDTPPRFSTLFGALSTASAAPPQPPPREYHQEYYPRPHRSPGIHMPTPLFVVFAVMLLFESTILFAYTVIGLYNNAPARLFPWAGRGSTTAVACDCAVASQQQYPTINFAPNFLLPLPQQQPGIPSPEANHVPINPTPQTPGSVSTAATDATAAAASDIAAILGGLTTSSSDHVATVTAIPLSTDVIVMTKDSSGKIVSSEPSTAPRSTVTAMTTVTARAIPMV